MEKVVAVVSTHRAPSVWVVSWDGEGEPKNCTLIHASPNKQQAIPHLKKEGGRGRGGGGGGKRGGGGGRRRKRRIEEEVEIMNMPNTHWSSSLRGEVLDGST